MISQIRFILPANFCVFQKLLEISLSYFLQRNFDNRHCGPFVITYMISEKLYIGTDCKLTFQVKILISFFFRTFLNLIIKMCNEKASSLYMYINFAKVASTQKHSIRCLT